MNVLNKIEMVSSEGAFQAYYNITSLEGQFEQWSIVKTIWPSPQTFRLRLERPAKNINKLQQ